MQVSLLVWIHTSEKAVASHQMAPAVSEPSRGWSHMVAPSHSEMALLHPGAKTDTWLTLIINQYKIILSGECHDSRQNNHFQLPALQLMVWATCQLEIGIISKICFSKSCFAGLSQKAEAGWSAGRRVFRKDPDRRYWDACVQDSLSVLQATKQGLNWFIRYCCYE